MGTWAPDNHGIVVGDQDMHELTSTPEEHARRLESVVRGMWHAARLVEQRPALCPELRLLLLDPAFSSSTLTPEETRTALETPAYWTFCWASGQALARYVLDRPGISRGKTVVDFGCGSGVVAIAAAKSGASRVIAVDQDELALEACRFNASLNGVTVRTCGSLADIREPIDLMLVADVLYDRENLPLLPVFLASAQELVLADSRLKSLPEPRLACVAQSESCTVPDLGEHSDFRHVRIYRGERDATAPGFGVP
jgi:predicted nicotinamide N-methyase